MSRKILDDDLQSWEVFVNTGPSGFSRPPRIVFRCASDPAVPSRMTLYEGEPRAALRLVDEGPTDELRQLLEGSTSLH